MLAASTGAVVGGSILGHDPSNGWQLGGPFEVPLDPAPSSPSVDDWGGAATATDGRSTLADRRTARASGRATAGATSLTRASKSSAVATSRLG